MGLISTFIDQDISFRKKRKDKLKTCLETLKKANDDGYADCIDLSKSIPDVDFSNWSGRKIEGYWYPEMVKFLKELAEYIDGYAEFQYEEGYSFRIVFKDQKVYFQKALNNWDEIDMGEL